MSNPSHYDVLGVAPTASRSEIQSAYRSAARRLHPDAGGDAVAMQRLNEAWHVLGDAGRRAVYDAMLRQNGPQQSTADRSTRGDPVAATDPDTGAEFQGDFEDDLGAGIDDVDDDVDDSADPIPVGAIHPLEGWIALLPPATALLAFSLLVGGMVLASPELLVFSGGAGLVALGMFVLAPLLAMSRSRRGRS
jgi:curved DNA-binding protein CbpA